MKPLITILLILAVSFIQGQTTTFQKLYKVDSMTIFSDISQTSDGGYIVCGSVAANASDHLIIKTDSNGQVQWSKHLGNTAYSESAYRVGEVSGGYYLLGISAAVGGQGNLNLVRFDGTGNILWNKSYGGSSSMDASSYPSVRVTTIGEFIISSTYYDTFSNSYYLFIKTDSNGNVLWSKKVAEMAGGKLECYDVEQSFEGNSYVAVGDGADVGLFIVSCDNSGNLLWTRKLVDTYSDFFPGYSICHTTDGGYAITSVAGNGNYPMLVKIDVNGNFLWARSYMNNSFVSMYGSYSVHQTSDGGYIMCNSFRSNFPLLIKTNSSGTFEWARYYTLSNGTNGYPSVRQTRDKGYAMVIAGTDSITGNSSGWLIKTDSLGRSGCHETSVTCVDSVIVLNALVQSIDSAGVPGIGITYPVTAAQVSCVATCNGQMDSGIEEISNSNSLIFPNPSDGEFTIRPKGLQIRRIEIYTLQGKRIFESESFRTSQSDISFNISSQPKGVYLVKLLSDEGVAYSRVIVQ